MSIILLVTSSVCYLIGLVFLLLSFGAYLLEDWRTDKVVRETMIMRLAFSVAFILVATFLRLVMGE